MLPLEADANSRWQERRVHGLMSILLYSPCGRTLLRCLYRVVNLGQG